MTPIVVVCGPPAAGKSTIASRAHDRLAERGCEFRTLHSDDFARRTYDRLYHRILGTDDRWLVDGTFYDRRWRERFRDLGGVRFVLVEASLETCLERNRRRVDAIDEEGVRAMHRAFDRPDADLVLDTEELSVDTAVDRLVRAVAGWKIAK